MTRSIGDYLAHTVGVSATPAITEYSLHPQDEIVIIASDGVWEYLENTEVGRLARKHYPTYNAEAAANDIVMAADAEWKKRGP
jgi:cGMP-dependent protein kinase